MVGWAPNIYLIVHNRKIVHNESIPIRRNGKYTFMGKCRYHLFFFLFLLLGCSQPITYRYDVKYPQWFWHPSIALSFPTAVGYSSIAPSHSDKALEDATEDGIERLAKAMKVHIHGEQAFLDNKFSGQLREEIDASMKEHVLANHKLLADYQNTIGTLTLVLVGLGKASNLSTLATAASPKPPSWINTLPSKSKYLYGRGVYKMEFRRPKNAWSAAEYYARVNLAFNIKSQIVLLRRTGRQNLENIVVSNTDITLIGIETVARWYNAENRNCYVLVRVPIAAN